MIEFKYRPDVDGIRAVAVTMVLLFHAGLGLPGGYVGVDVFFVISGFLITGLILKEQGQERFSLANFWARRIRRIIPAATLVAVACLFAGMVLMLPADLEDLSESVVAQQLMLSNVYFWRHSDYFAGPSELMPLLHTWSLAVEEQFYLAYPLMLALLRRVPRRAAACSLLAIGMVSLLASEWIVNRYASAAFFLLPTRAWELLLGALLVYCPEPRRLGQRWNELGAWVGIALILAAGIWFNSETPFPGFTALVPCVGTFMVIYFNSTGLTSLGKILAGKQFVFVGLISYSLYLWHWPILVFTRYAIGTEPSLGVRIVALAASFLMAIVSWKFVETPFRKRFTDVTTAKLVAGAVISAAMIAGVSMWINDARGLPGRLPPSVRELAAPIPVSGDYGVTIEAIREAELPTLGASGAADRAADFIVWGDSHAMALGACLDSLAMQHHLSGVIAGRIATVPILGVCIPGMQGRGAETPEWNESALGYIREKRIRNVILIARWAAYVEGSADGRTDLLVAENMEESTNRQSARSSFEHGLRRTLDALRAMGARVWIMKQIPLQDVRPQHAVAHSVYWGYDIPKGVSIDQHVDRQRHANAIIERQVKCRSDVYLIDPTQAYFDVDGHSILGSHLGSYYRDNDHVSDFGAEQLLRPLFDPIFSEIAETKISE